MKLKTLIALSMLVLVLGLSACTGAPSDADPTATPEPVTQAAPTAESPAPTETGSGSETSSDLPESDPTCEVDPPLPTPNPTDEMLFAPDPEEDWIKGPDDALITIVEYADFQCPYCAEASRNLQALMERYPGDVRVVYRHFPLDSIHDKAVLSTQAAEAAGLQDAFWEMHDLLYETQAEWSDLDPAEFTAWAADQAEELGMDRDQFLQDMNSESIASEAQAAWTEGQELGLPGTPYLKINRVFDAQADPVMLTTFVEMIKLQEEQFSQCPPLEIQEGEEYQAVLKTEKGDIVIELFPDTAPLAVNSFIFLAENDWFDDVSFHRVLEGFVAQTGDPTGTGFGGPGYSFGVETEPGLVFDRGGLVALANSGPGTNGSQFFITYSSAPSLNGQYTIFGEVIDGMEVAESLTPRNPQENPGAPPGDLLLDVVIEKK